MENTDNSMLQMARGLSRRLSRYRAYRAIVYLFVFLVVIPVASIAALVMSWLAELRFLLIENMIDWYEALRNEYALFPPVLRAEWRLWKKRNDPK